MPRHRSRLEPELLRVLWWTAAFSAVIAACSVVRWNDWNYGYDLGIFAQVVWNVPRGFVDQPEFGTHFRFHFAPLLAVLWPAMAIFRTPMVLEWAQLLLISAATPLTYVLFRRHAEARTCMWIALVTLANPFLYSQAFNEFHELCFFPVVALGLVWALDRRRWSIAVLCSLLAFCVREDAALVTVFALCCFAVMGVFGERSRRLTMLCAGLALIGVAVLTAYFVIGRSLLGGWKPVSFYYYAFAHSPQGVVAALFTKPAQAWPQLLTPGRAGYLLEALAVTALLPLRSKYMVLCIPGLALVLLANNWGVWRIGAQYALVWLPWMVVAFGDALLGLRAQARPRWLWANAAVLAIVAVAGNPMHLGTYLRPSYHDLGDARRALASVGNVALSTHSEWQTQISVQDPLANSALSGKSRWFVYAKDYPNAQFQTQITPLLRELMRRGAIREVRDFGPVAVYRREKHFTLDPVAAQNARREIQVWN